MLHSACMHVAMVESCPVNHWFRKIFMCEICNDLFQMIENKNLGNFCSSIWPSRENVFSPAWRFLGCTCVEEKPP